MSDHSWVHLQIVVNRALRVFRLLRQRGVQSSLEIDYGLEPRDAEVVIAGGCLLHDLGMSIHRVDHEAFSLFLAADHLELPARRGLRGAGADDRRLRDRCTRSSATAAAAGR